MFNNRKAQALAVAFLATLATGQAKAEAGFHTKVEAESIANVGAGLNSKAGMYVGISCGKAQGSSEVKAKSIANLAAGVNSNAQMKVATVDC